MNLKLTQDKFEGDPEDLQAFLQLATTPVRSEKRTEALATWRDYKLDKLVRLWSDLSPQLVGNPPSPLVLHMEGESLSHEILADEPTPNDAYFPKGWKALATERHLINLTKANLDGICLGFVDLRGVKLDGASLRGAWLKSAELEWASLRNADLSEARLLRADLLNAKLQGANLCSADLSDTTLCNADLTDAKLCNANLTRANLVGANLEGTDLKGSRIYGISAWDVSLCQDKDKRRDLIITTPDEPEVRVDDIEVAQFIYLLLNRKKLRNVINAVTKKGVLILGRFSDGGLKVLREIASTVRNYGYLPILFDFDKPDDRDYTDTVRTLAGLARFAIVELSGRSVPQELMATVPHVEIPFVSILQKGLEPHSMFKDLLKYRWVQPDVVFYTDSSSLCSKLHSDVIQQAEAMIHKKQLRLSKY